MMTVAAEMLAKIEKIEAGGQILVVDSFHCPKCDCGAHRFEIVWGMEDMVVYAERTCALCKFQWYYPMPAAFTDDGGVLFPLYMTRDEWDAHCEGLKPEITVKE